MKIIDSHMHLDLLNQNPVEELINKMNENNIEAGVLILNTIEEMSFIENNIVNLIESNITFHFALLLDINNVPQFNKYYKILRSFNTAISIKLYSRLSNIQKKDFKRIFEYLSSIEFSNIIIDGFYFGSNLDSHIMLELAIYLTDKFPNHNLIFAHFGGVKVLETMLYTRDISNMYYDTSFTPNYLYNTSVKHDMVHCIKYSYKKTMFGSDYPSFKFADSIGVLYEMMEEAELSEPIQHQIFRNNAKEIYKLERNE